MQTSTASRLKRKAPSTNHAAVIQSTSKKLDATKSTEFELRDQNASTNHSTANLASSHSLDRENDVEDFADRLFNYLDETCTKPLPHPIDNNPINSSSTPQSVLPAYCADPQVKSLLCAFCPYTAQNIHEFQTHIAKHTEKNFRCLLCNCMYKYRRDCVTHMKRKHANSVTGSISQYIQKITSPTPHKASIHPSSSTPLIQPTSSTEPKRYGCPYCSLMTKSTSSIYKHQSRKHASFPKIVHKYSTDDPNTRNLVAILQQKSLKKAVVPALENEALPKPSIADESVLDLSSSSSSSSSLLQQQTEPFSLVNRQPCSVSKHITAHHMQASTGRFSKCFQCRFCNYRASHRNHVARHVTKVHLVDRDESDLSTAWMNTEADGDFAEQPTQSDDISEKLIIDCDETLDESHAERTPSYSLNTTVQAPLVLHSANGDNHSVESYADIHLSINIFLPKRKKHRQMNQAISEGSQSESSEEEISDSDDQRAKIQVSSSPLSPFSSGSLYKPHKCRRCFYRSNWKTDMLHHVRHKHQIEHATKADYLSMDADTALRSFSTYEQTFGKVLKNRLLLPKIGYIDCTWEELQSKLFINADENRSERRSPSLSAIPKTSSSLNNDESDLFRDNNHQPRF